MMEYNLGPLCKLRDWIHFDNLDLDCLSENINAIALLEQFPEKINYVCLSSNPNAIHLLEQNMDKIDWSMLSMNPNAIHILEQNIDKIDWYRLSLNQNTIHLLEKNIDKIVWHMLSENPSIFEYDWVAMRNRMKLIEEELVANRFHPKNMDKFVSWGFEDFDLE